MPYNLEELSPDVSSKKGKIPTDFEIPIDTAICPSLYKLKVCVRSYLSDVPVSLGKLQIIVVVEL